MNIQGSLEFVAAVKLLAVEGKKIAKDGINLADIPEALVLLNHLDLVLKAAKDFHEVGAELKDIDQAELIQLGSALYEAFQEIKNA